MGVLINRVADAKVFEDALREIQSIVRASVQIAKQPQQIINGITAKNVTYKANDSKQDVVAKKPEPSFLDKLSQAFGLSDQNGYCIRDCESIPFDVKHPLCHKHWEESHERNSIEHYCHSCGKQYNTTLKTPLCPSCYKKNKS